MSEKTSRFGWVDAVFFFLLFVIILKTFKILVYVSALNDLTPRCFPAFLQDHKVVIPFGSDFARWVAEASASNPFLSYVQRLTFVVLCLTLVCLILAIRLLLKRGRHGDDTKASASQE